ncbi:amino acid adenylation domain-containing protein [Longimicrobium sp.]|uniref:non-ribosomal peptide synthetase n=1 Tax=Longimicrobium sp. TaxID=2029185 RepID=UPI002C078540|nr:amino acid adenylation domain-containing protein [Longimicrobium sp.]HSU16452.1 amino acid adenylation domain-containing protein [Longimicrobium sp.]
MTELTDRFAGLSRAKRALLEAMLRRPAAGAIPRAADGPVPLTWEQRRLWFLHRLAPDAAVYTIPIGYRLHGGVDAAALESALRALAARHDVLRMTFGETDGEPVAATSPEPHVGWETADVTDLPEAEREADARRQVRAFLARTFDLARGPLMRALLVRVAPREHVLVIALHHVAGDGWSTGILRRELGALYAAARGGTDASLPPPAARFRDFAAWQRKALDERTLAADAEFWRRELEAAPHVFEIIPDRARPPLQGLGGAKAAAELAPALTAEVRALARREGTTPFAVFAAAWAAVLHRHAGADDFLLGTLDANRWMPETEGTIGFFANTVPLRFRFDGNPTVREAIRRAHRTVVGAREHARLPFDRTVEIAGVRRDPARPPLVQSLLVYGDNAAAYPSFPGIEASYEVVDTGTSAFDMALVAEEMGGRLHLELQFSTDLYEPATAHRLLRRLRVMLEGFARDVDRPLAAVPLADAEEVRRVTMDWNRTDLPIPALCIHQAFERHARERPDRIAIEADGDGGTTYGELNARANRIAHRLRRLGARPEARVGVCMRRTPELVAAMLGVLKSGAAYVPLDPAHPPARIAAVLRAAGAQAVLTDDASRGALEEAGRVMAISLNSADFSAESDADLAAAAAPGNLAYVISTSGSSGVPKGVEIEHRGAAALLEWVRRTVAEEERESVLAASSVTFDPTLMEIWGPLSWGGRVVLTGGPLDAVPDGSAPTLAFMVPSIAAELLRERRFPATLRTLMIGGEPVPPALARDLYGAGTLQRVVNVYGPTEDTTYSTAWEVPRDVRRMAIGAPLANGRAYVLDAAMRPAAIGVPGEIWLGGAGVARGYAGRPALTAESFVPDPCGAPGSRMYRTLDAGRWLEDGTIEHLGRRDAQVKVRGVRIETGEVETALAAHPAVAGAAVDARGAMEARRLVAWLVSRDGEARPTSAELRQHLRGRLPDAMVPAAFAWVDALPRTSSGKTDRRALPDPPADEAAATGRATQPRSPIEAKLAAIWAEVLGLERVGIHDDFFDLGGHSIIAARLAARVRAELGRELPLAAILRAPTVARLAGVLAGERAAVHPPLIPLQPHGGRPPLFLAPPGGGHVVCYHPLGGLLGPDQPVYGLQARGIDDGHLPLETVEEVAAYFASAVRELQPEGPYLLGGWSFGGLVAWEMGRQMRAAGHDVALVALLDTGIPTPRERIVDDTLDHARVLQRIVADLIGWAGASLVRVEKITHLPPRQQAVEAVRQVNSPRALPESRVDEILTLTRVRLANLCALVSYDPPVYDGHLTYVRTAASDRALPVDGAIEFWSSRALGGATVHRIAGSHGTLLQPPFVEDLAARLTQSLAAALAPASDIAAGG